MIRRWIAEKLNALRGLPTPKGGVIPITNHFNLNETYRAPYHTDLLRALAMNDKNIELQVGKTYTTRGGDTVEITEQAGGTFVGKVTRKSRPGQGQQFFRAYSRSGRLAPMHANDFSFAPRDMRDDIVAENIQSPKLDTELTLEVGKKYDTFDGRVVEIVHRNENCSSPAEEFIGLVPSSTQPDKTMPRTYYANGRSSGCRPYVRANRDLIREHVEKPPFALKVGEVYPTRDGKGFGFTVGQSAFVERTFSAVVFAGGLAVDRTYWADGRGIRNADNPTDLVEGPIRGDDYAFIKAMAVREVMRLALDIASGKRSVGNYAWSPDVMHVMTLDGRCDRPLQSGTTTFTGPSFTLEVQHGGVNS